MFKIKIYVTDFPKINGLNARYEDIVITPDTYASIS